MLIRVHGREARPASGAANLLKTGLQALLFWIVFFFAVPFLLTRVESLIGMHPWRFPSDAARCVGVVLFAAAGALNLACAYYLAVSGRGTPLPADCPRELVITGPYRYLRNPMATAALIQGAAVGLYLGSPLVVGYAAAGALVWQLLIRPWEEADLEDRFGEPYRGYRRAVHCWVPRRTPYGG